MKIKENLKLLIGATLLIPLCVSANHAVASVSIQHEDAVDHAGTVRNLVATWSGSGVFLKVDDLVQYDGKTYKVLQAHTTQSDWDPARVPALFMEVTGWEGGVTEWEGGVALTAHQLVRYNDRFWRVIQAHTTQADQTPDITPALYLLVPASADWEPQVQYYLGEVVKYGGITYRCVHSHVSQEAWTPDASVTLWVEDDSVLQLELASKGAIREVVDLADSSLNLLSQLESEIAPLAYNNDTMTDFEKDLLLDVLPKLRPYICFLNGRVPMTPADVAALESEIFMNPAYSLVKSTLEAGGDSTAGEVRARLAAKNPGDFSALVEFQEGQLAGLADGDSVPGLWKLSDGGEDFSFPDTVDRMLRRSLIFSRKCWKKIGGAALVVVGVVSVVVGVVQIATGVGVATGIGTIVGGLSSVAGGLEALGVDVPLVDGGGFNANCPIGSGAIDPTSCTIKATNKKLRLTD